jgi:hypothetical protein
MWGALAGGGGGFSGSSEANSTQNLGLGGFQFAPKSSTIPPVAWIALAAVGAVALVLLLKR